MVHTTSPFVAAFSFFLAAAGAADTSSVEPQCPSFDAEALDVDLDGVVLAWEWAPTVDGCCHSCEEMEGCIGFSYFEQFCYLKGSFAGTFRKVGVISRLKSSLESDVPAVETPRADLVATKAPASAPDLLPLRGICYAPLPCLDMDKPCAAPEDMAQEGYRPQWGGEGRNDLAIMKGMGANVIRLYHPIGEPRAPQPDASGFLDASDDVGLKVFGAVHQYLWCEDDDCYASWFKAVQDGLAKGFAKDGAWHPAVWAMNLINEVDAHVGEGARYVKRLISAVDGLLEAEREAQIQGNVNLTSCFTTALASPLGGGPATVYHGFSSMEAWLKDSSLVEYTPRNRSITDLARAIDKRWVHCVNAQIPWEYGLKGMLADQYAHLLPRPWFIGEMGFNGAHGNDLQKELEAMHTYAMEGNGFLGTFFFQFQTAYFKGQGPELNFGMFSLGATQVDTTGELGGQTFPVHCLTSRLWAFEQPGPGCKDNCSHRAQAVAKAFGGQISGSGVCKDAQPLGYGAKRRRLRHTTTGDGNYYL